MDDQFHEIVQVNIKGRVFVICQTYGISDISVIDYYNQIVEKAVFALLNGEYSIETFHSVLEEQAQWLDKELQELTGISDATAPAAQFNETQINDIIQPPEQTAATHKAEKMASGFIPEAKSMPERLKDQRSEIEHLLFHDCVTLKLVTEKQAKAYKRNMLGRAPEKAEAELVAGLRNVLHEQIQKFIRKHQGGPWQNATQQTEIRMEIAHTKTLQSLVNLSKQLLQEREEWVSKTKTSLVGRLFGGRVKLKKPKSE
jgi:hypothetical protein